MIAPAASWLTQFEPEADIHEVAKGHFGALALPILVAAHDDEQFEEFVWRNALMCTEVKRLHRCRQQDLASYPGNKILIQLPAWEENPQTRPLALHWINQLDRYTCQLRGPAPVLPPEGSLALPILLALAIWSVTAWIVMDWFKP